MPAPAGPVAETASAARRPRHPLEPVAWLAVLGLLLAPAVTWLPMLALRLPALGLPVYPPGPGMDLWSIQAFWLITLGAVAAVVGARDRIAGVVVAMTAVILFYRGAAMDPTHTVVFAMGMLLLAGLRSLPRSSDQTVRWAVVAVAAFQAAYMAQQRFLNYDFFWGPVLGGVLAEKMQMVGTLGYVNAAAGLLAVTVPLMPLWLGILCAALVIMSHSLSAVAALVVGLALCLRNRMATLVVGAAGLAAGAVVLHKATHGARLMIWDFALRHWAVQAPVTGWGLGGWFGHVPALQAQYNFSPSHEYVTQDVIALRSYWGEAHSEPIQWLTEMGLIGAALLIAWLWTHRAMFADPLWGPSVAAIAVQTLGWHPFHIVTSALLGLIVIGLASRPPQEDTACAVA